MGSKPTDENVTVAVQAAASSSSFLVGALQRRPLRQPPDIGGEFRPLRNDLEHHAPAQRRSHHHVGGGELLAHEIRALLHRFRHHVHDGVVVAVAERALPRAFLARKCAVKHCGFEATWPEEQPFEIDAAARIADRNVQACLGELVRQIGADRRRLGDGDVAVLERRNLTHRIDREIVGLALLAFHQAQEMEVVGFADLLQHPAGNRRARRCGMIKCQLGHAVPPLRVAPCYRPNMAAA